MAHSKRALSMTRRCRRHHQRSVRRRWRPYPRAVIARAVIQVLRPRGSRIRRSWARWAALNAVTPPVRTEASNLASGPPGGSGRRRAGARAGEPARTRPRPGCGPMHTRHRRPRTGILIKPPACGGRTSAQATALQQGRQRAGERPCSRGQHDGGRRCSGRAASCCAATADSTATWAPAGWPPHRHRAGHGAERGRGPRNQTDRQRPDLADNPGHRRAGPRNSHAERTARRQHRPRDASRPCRDSPQGGQPGTAGWPRTTRGARESGPGAMASAAAEQRNADGSAPRRRRKRPVRWPLPRRKRRSERDERLQRRPGQRPVHSPH